MLKLFRKISRFDSFNEDYITIVYCDQNQRVSVNDTLSGNNLGSFDNGSFDKHFCCAQSQGLGMESSFEHSFNFSGPLIDHGPSLLTNPASGMAMVDDFFDAAGNMFGFGGDSNW